MFNETISGHQMRANIAEEMDGKTPRNIMLGGESGAKLTKEFADHGLLHPGAPGVADAQKIAGGKKAIPGQPAKKSKFYESGIGPLSTGTSFGNDTASVSFYDSPEKRDASRQQVHGGNNRNVSIPIDQDSIDEGFDSFLERVDKKQGDTGPETLGKEEQHDQSFMKGVREVFDYTNQTDPSRNGFGPSEKRDLEEWEKKKMDAVRRCSSRALAIQIASFTEEEFNIFSAIIHRIDLMDTFRNNMEGAIVLRDWPMFEIKDKFGESVPINVTIKEISPLNQMHLSDELQQLLLSQHSKGFIDKVEMVSYVSMSLHSFGGQVLFGMKKDPINKKPIEGEDLESRRNWVMSRLSGRMIRRIYELYNMFIIALDWMVQDFETLKKNL